MSLWSLTPRLLRVFDPETAHRLTIAGLRLGLHPRTTHAPSDLATQTAASPDSGSQAAIRLFGKTLPNRLGLAAGFDKDAEAVPALAALGFAAVEVGSVTPLPQPGNPRPRVFRLPADAAVVNATASIPAVTIGSGATSTGSGRSSAPPCSGSTSAPTRPRKTCPGTLPSASAGLPTSLTIW